MATAKETPSSPPAAPAPSRIARVAVTLRQNYGSKMAGARIEVELSEYERLRAAKPGGEGFTFPVMISDADARAEDQARRAAEEQAQKQAQKADLERSTADGWAEWQRRAAEITKVNQVAQQRALHEQLTGTAGPVDPAEQAKQFQERVAAGRAG